MKTLLPQIKDSIIGLIKKKKEIYGDMRPEFILIKNPKSPVAEAYRMFRTNIEFLGEKRGIKSIIVTSSGPREGKTTTVVNLGCAFAQANKKTLIVDSDLRNNSFHRLFKLNNSAGFTSVVTGQKKIEEVVYNDPALPNLYVLTSGPKPENPAEFMDSKKTRDFIGGLKDLYDIVIFDSPPTLAVADAKLLSLSVDGVLLVIQCGKVAREVAERAIESLREVNANILGVVLNNLDTKSQYYYYYHKYYYYYYTEEGKKAKVGAVQKPEPQKEAKAAEAPAEPKRKDLFIPNPYKNAVSEKWPPKSEKSIISLLSEEEKKEAEKADRGRDKDSVLGKKIIFFEKEKKDNKDNKAGKPAKGKGKDNVSGLGKKDIFKDL